MDSAEAYNDCEGNSGWESRKKMIENGRVCDFSVDLHSDITSIEKLWPNGLDVTLRLTRAPDSFSLMAMPSVQSKPEGYKSDEEIDADNSISNKAQEKAKMKAKLEKHRNAADKTIPDYRIIFNELLLHIDKIEMSPGTLQKHEAMFNAGKLAVYPFCKTVIKTKQAVKGDHYAKFENVFMNRLPQSVVVALVKSSAYQGDITENPWNFQHFFVNYLAFKKNSEVLPPNGKDFICP